ncbi:MAG: hypothetical protein ACYCWN_09605 [Ferrimicrobium sp.]|jgi:hypothetical protein|uniref:Uncharacterized protein n=1 Tax=Ferrimicrobium acidiphilum TaxID=121039 RepID=A0ABV3Y2C8_9ACTN|nr:hypothetical protein [Ferrimicrobium sp.]
MDPSSADHSVDPQRRLSTSATHCSVSRANGAPPSPQLASRDARRRHGDRGGRQESGHENLIDERAVDL